MTVAYAVLIVSAIFFIGMIIHKANQPSDAEKSLVNMVTLNDRQNIESFRDLAAKIKKTDIEVGHLRADLAELRHLVIRIQSQPKRVSHYHYHDKVPVPRRPEIRA